MQPVDAEGLGLIDYHTIITEPMDLGTVKSKLDQGKYSSPDEFADDIGLMFNNCYKYNAAGDDVVECGKKLQEIFLMLMTKLPTAADLPANRRARAASAAALERQAQIAAEEARAAEEEEEEEEEEESSEEEEEESSEEEEESSEEESSDEEFTAGSAGGLQQVRAAHTKVIKMTVKLDQVKALEELQRQALAAYKEISKLTKNLTRGKKKRGGGGGGSSAKKTKKPKRAARPKAAAKKPKKQRPAGRKQQSAGAKKSRQQKRPAKNAGRPAAQRRQQQQEAESSDMSSSSDEEVGAFDMERLQRLAGKINHVSLDF